MGTLLGTHFQIFDVGIAKKRLESMTYDENGVPTGIRTPVASVKGRCPRPLDDGDLRISTAFTTLAFYYKTAIDLITFARFGGGKRDRTADLLHAMQALSQLSYTPVTYKSSV